MENERAGCYYRAARRTGRPKRKSPYKNSAFVNLSDEVPEKMRALVKENPNAYLVWNYFVVNMDKYNTIVCPMTVLMQTLSISKSSVVRAIRTLKAHGFISIQKCGSGNIYFIDDNIVQRN